MPQIEFTYEEYALLARSAEKLMKAKKDMPPQQWRKPQNQAIKRFAKLFNTEPEQANMLTRILTRNDIRIVQEIAEVGVSALNSNIIPAYKERLTQAANDPKRVEYYTPYLQKAEATLNLFIALRTKVEAEL